MKKTSKYIKNFSSAFLKPIKVFNTPIHMHIEPTTFCNLSCPQCTRDFFIKKPQNLSFENFKRAIDLIKPYYISLTGLGESFLNPEIFQLIYYSKKNGISVNTTSNFVNINEVNMKNLINSGLNLLNISIDAANKDTYKKVRGTDHFDTILKNIEKFNRIKKDLKLKIPYIRLCFVMQKNNLSEMIEFLNLANDLNVDAILYQIFEPSIEDKKYLVNNIDLSKMSEEIDTILSLEKKIRIKTNASFLKDNIEDIKKVYSGKKLNRFKKCIMPWISLFVTVEGNVEPCCRFGTKEIKEELNMGNIFNTQNKVQNILNLFNNEKKE